MSDIGQVTHKYRLGRLLTELARDADTIVEIGTWHGWGSTKCIHEGMTRPGQRLFTVEISETVHHEAAARYNDSRITFLHGTIVLPEEFGPADHPDKVYLGCHEMYREANTQAPYVFDLLPAAIDLLFIDGGEWTADAEFLKLHPRSRTIVLDDTNPLLTNKNPRNRIRLLGMGWKIIEDNSTEKNGFIAATRP